MGMVKHAKVFKNGRNRAVRIPVEFEFAGDDVTITKEGSRIIIEPVEKKMDFFEWLESREPWDEDDFPDLDLKEPPPEAVDL